MIDDLRPGPSTRSLRKNPVPILIPCHRVVRSDGHIGEYALGGRENKRAILAAEGLQQEEIQRLARRRSRNEFS
jgi:methylated-DNA-[protein]-cysteine S-methyltransferase